MYVAIEEEMDKNANNKTISLIHFPKELNRKEALEADLEFFYGPDWEKKTTTPTKAAVDYVKRIKEISKTKPELLVAHAYTRYLGDLSGGQVGAHVPS